MARPLEWVQTEKLLSAWQRMRSRHTPHHLWSFDRLNPMPIDTRPGAINYIPSLDVEFTRQTVTKEMIRDELLWRRCPPELLVCDEVSEMPSNIDFDRIAATMMEENIRYMREMNEAGMHAYVERMLVPPEDRARYTSRHMRHIRFAYHHGQGKTLGEINDLLCQEGFSEIRSGEGFIPCPTEQHRIVRKNTGARRHASTVE